MCYNNDTVLLIALYMSEHSPFSSAKEFYASRRFDIPKPNLPDKQLPTKDRQEIDHKVFKGQSRENYVNYVEAIHSTEAKKTFEKVCLFCEKIKEHGGRALLAGGAVRDEVLGIASKDFDVEVYGLDADMVESVATNFGNIKDVGKAFGILKLSDEEGVEIDISLPRTDSKIGAGHRGFEVKVDPKMSVAEAAKRRDFTFNALSKDPLTGEIFDPYGGVDDLKHRRLRVTDEERFKDDPLRLLRGAQFVGRFGLSVEPDTMKIMREMVPDLEAISTERVREEWEKLLLRAERPSMGLEFLNNVGIIDKYYPELAVLRGTEQEFEWHPEGDVWIHTLMVVDSARNIVRQEKLNNEEARIQMLTALCHDLGKPLTTAFVDGRLRSHAHDIKGVEPTTAFLERIGARKDDIKKVTRLVKEHIWPTTVYLEHKKHGQKVTEGAFRKLATRLHPATIEELSYVCEADCLGMGPFFDKDNPNQLMLQSVSTFGMDAAKWTRAMAEKLEINKTKPRSLVSGRDLIMLGHAPGSSFGEIIRLCDECRNSACMAETEILRLLSENPGDTKKTIDALESAITNHKK